MVDVLEMRRDQTRRQQLEGEGGLQSHQETTINETASRSLECWEWGESADRESCAAIRQLAEY